MQAIGPDHDVAPLGVDAGAARPIDETGDDAGVVLLEPSKGVAGDDVLPAEPRGSAQTCWPCLLKKRSASIGAATRARCSSSPSSASSRTALGCRLMPKPSASIRGAASKTLAAMPAAWRLNAAVSPPMPPPTMTTRIAARLCLMSMEGLCPAWL
jgi:hypothetical protein